MKITLFVVVMFMVLSFYAFGIDEHDAFNDGIRAGEQGITPEPWPIPRIYLENRKLEDAYRRGYAIGQENKRRNRNPLIPDFSYETQEQPRKDDPYGLKTETERTGTVTWPIYRW